MDKIHQIFERIKEEANKNGDEHFSYNTDKGYETELETLMNYFRYERLKWCGCGSVEESNETVRKFLDAHRDFDNRRDKMKEYFGVHSIYDEPLLQCLAYTMDAAGFTEHGTSIYGAWLTEDGKDYLYCLEQE